MKKLLMMAILMSASNAFAVPNEGEYGPAWSPDGRFLAYHKNSEGIFWDLMIKDLSSGETMQVSDNPGYDTGASWAPDSSKLVFSSSRNGNRDIFIYDLETGQTNPLIEHEAMDNQAVWSPDGKAIAFLSRRHGSSQLYLYEFKNKSITQLTDNQGQVFHPSWTADSQSIVYDQSEDKLSRIYRLDLATGKQEFLYSNNSSAISASLKGKWLTLTTNKAGNWDIIRVNLITKEEEKLVFSDNNEIKGVWDAKGHRLAYSHQNESGVWLVKTLTK